MHSQLWVGSFFGAVKVSYWRKWLTRPGRRQHAPWARLHLICANCRNYQSLAVPLILDNATIPNFTV